jgi:hypothetical protein
MDTMRFRGTVLIFFVLILFSLRAFSQEMPKDKLFYVHEEVARLDKIDQYNKSGKDFSAMMKSMKLDVPYIRASETDDFHFFYMVPLNNYADIDKLSDAFNNMFSSAEKNKVDELMKESDESVEYTKEMVFRRSESLSYAPADAKMPDMSKEAFLHFDYYTYKPENRKEVMDIGAKIKKLYEDKKIEYPYSVWLSDMGVNSNLIIVTTLANDAASYYQEMDKESKMLGKEMDDLWNQMKPMLTHYEQQNGKTRPDLSYMKEG